MNILYTLIKPKIQTITKYNFHEKASRENSFGLRISYKKLTDFKHLFKFSVVSYLVGDDNSALSFPMDFDYDVRFDDVVDFPSKPDVKHLEIILDVVVDVMDGVIAFANDFKSRDPLITASSFKGFSEKEIINVMKDVKTFDPIIGFSDN